MAKQTFTTGQVLTADQMTTLQTNDFNQTVSQKTASYVLVAADKGTRIEINSASATTVTVNNSLFTAGDTVIIQNIGAGISTVTAGTATVSKATNASLALAQYQGGNLYFISASAAVFFPFDAGSTGGTFNMNFQDFTASGTYTVPTGVTNALIFACGGGGGSGGATSSAVNRQASGGGGGGGDVVLQPVAVTSGASITVTIGAGGTAGVAANGAGGVGGNTTFGSLLTAAGGGGGGGSNTSATSGTVVSSPNYSAGGGGGGGARGDATNVNGNAGGGGGATSWGFPPYTQIIAVPANYIYTAGSGGGAKGGATSQIFKTLSSAGNMTVRGGDGGVGFYNYGAGGGGAGDNGGGRAGGAKAGDGGSGNNGGSAAIANWGGGGGGAGSQDSAVATAGSAGGSGFLRVMWVA